MTRVLIIGGGGMIGQQLSQRLATAGLGNGRSTKVTLFDIAFPDTPVAAGIRKVQGDLTDDTALTNLISERYDVIFHLASIVSGEAEADFEKGWRSNMLPMWSLLDAIRVQHLESAGRYRPRLVFTSSVAVFGPPYPAGPIPDDFAVAPQTSYGAQKVAGEIMLSDFSRKGYVDGVSLRLPTVCVRPGKPNRAASSFISDIIREPLNGATAILPVPESTCSWLSSPRSVTGFLCHAATFETEHLKGRRTLNMPGCACTVAEQIQALHDVAGQEAVDLIRVEPDETIRQIVGQWPQAFAATRALELGFVAETSFDEIIQVYLADLDTKRDSSRIQPRVTRF